jgi:hypothetical protein
MPTTAPARWAFNCEHGQLKTGDPVTNAANGEALGELTLDEDKRHAILRVAAKRPQPETLSIGPGSPFSTEGDTFSQFGEVFGRSLAR